MDIFVNRDGQNLGPYTKAELSEMVQTGGISADTPAWCEGMEEWSTVGDLITETQSGLTEDMSAPSPPPAGADIPLVAPPPSGARNRSTKLRPPGADAPPSLPPKAIGDPSSPSTQAPSPAPAPAPVPASSSPEEDPALATLRMPDHPDKPVISSAPRDVSDTPGGKKRKRKKKSVELPLSWLKFVGVLCVVGIFLSLFLPWIKAGPPEALHRANLGELFLTSEQVQGQLQIDTPKFLRFLLLVSVGGILLSALFASFLSVRLGVWPLNYISISACGVVMFGLSMVGFLYFFYDIRLENLAEASNEARSKFVPVVMDTGFYMALAIFIAMIGIFTLPDSSKPSDLPSELIVPLLFFAGATFVFFKAEGMRKEADVSFSELPGLASEFISELDKAWLKSGNGKSDGQDD